MDAQDPQLVRYNFKRLLEDIAECEGRGTELITLYIPPGRAIADVMNYLRNEYAQAGNIKSRVTRKNVMGSLESLMNKVKQYRTAPEHGVALFVGAKAIGADRSEDVSFVIEPPEPLNTYMYRCDSHFILDPLLDMVHEPETWGLIVIDRKEVTFGLLRGKRVEPLRNKQSQVPSKHGMGGQSAHRFERLIEHAAHEFFVRCGDMATELFLPHKDNLKGILVGGPGATKEFFIKEGFLHYELQKKVVEPLFDVGYTDEYGLRELVEKASNTLHGLEVTAEKKLIQQLLSEIRKQRDSLAIYGLKETKAAMQAGAVKTLLVSEALKDKELVTSLFELASANGAEVRMISSESEEGEMLLKAFGGLAAIMRYAYKPT
ncbi:MAG: peptide chain release factor aRF-1 [Candidatus Thermoplasmatota archaeon]|jgi:peptide chain release factor subunit 1|nr:peptide chain release factor aRF-1 [Candidatus Thermoplasmatota archaeon]MCL5984254.1 peptide chain release factor aRF-1 [Candidatus Thermoplasmatota archaeon]